MPYFAYITMLHLYETLGFWRRSADVKRIHFAEEINEFNHLLIMESLGGDQRWWVRFLAQHSAIVTSSYFAIYGPFLRVFRTDSRISSRLMRSTPMVNSSTRTKPCSRSYHLRSPPCSTTRSDLPFGGMYSLGTMVAASEKRVNCTFFLNICEKATQQMRQPPSNTFTMQRGNVRSRIASNN
jgi:hypothetical protein